MSWHTTNKIEVVLFCVACKILESHIKQLNLFEGQQRANSAVGYFGRKRNVGVK